MRDRKDIDQSEIHKSGVRRAIKPRREPYWQRIQHGQYIGYRKLETGSETWIARLRAESAKSNEEGKLKHFYESLGKVTDDRDTFDQAKGKALLWFPQKLRELERERDKDSDTVETIADACRRYVKERRTSKSPSCARDAEARFERTVYDDPLGARPIAKVRAVHIKTWRDGLDMSAASKNRTLVALKAALNLAVRERNVDPAQAQEWRDVKPLPGAYRRRDLFLDIEQRRALVKAASGAVRDLIEAAMLTGARAGELVNATRKQFDKRHGSMQFTGKTGTRVVPLSPAAITLFSRLAESKLPNAHLLVKDDGKPFAHSDWDEDVREAAAKAKLPTGVCLYTLRHSFITTALTSGMATLDVARLVGTSIAMIEKSYGHLVASAARERLAKVEML
jgi:integrase